MENKRPLHLQLQCRHLVIYFIFINIINKTVYSNTLRSPKTELRVQIIKLYETEKHKYIYKIYKKFNNYR